MSLIRVPWTPWKELERGAKEADGGGKSCRGSASEPLEKCIQPGMVARTVSFPH